VKAVVRWGGRLRRRWRRVFGVYDEEDDAVAVVVSTSLVELDRRGAVWKSVMVFEAMLAVVLNGDELMMS
jgi:hypothetical protein